MKNLFKLSGILLLVLAVVFFVYGSMKTVEAEDSTATEIDLGEGLTMTQESQAENFAGKAFTIATVAGVGGVLLLLVGRGLKKR